MASVPVFCRDFWAERKKAPEGDCSPGKKGLMILYLFVVVGVLDLERNCHVAMLAISLDNNANVCPSAILVDIDICIGIDLLRDLVQNETQYRILIGEVRRHENRQILFVLTLYFATIVAFLP